MRPIKYFLALFDKKSGYNAKEVGISTIRNGKIESIHTDSLETLLKHPPEE
jgi:hypothetical protein